MTRAPLTAALLLAVALVPVAVGGASATAADACAAADALTTAGYPQQATALLADAGKDAQARCTAAQEAAAVAIATAQALALQAQSSSGDDAQALAQRALQLDRENAAAAEVQAEPSPPQQQQSDYQHFAQRYIQPLGALILPVLAVLLALLVLARLLPLVVSEWPVLGGRRRNVLERPEWVIGIGLACAALGAGLLTLGVADAAVDGPLPWFWAAAIACGALAAIATAQLRRVWVVPRPADPPAAPAVSVAQGVWLAGLVAAGVLLVPALLRLAWLVPLLLGGWLAVLGVLLVGLWLATRLRLSIVATGGDDEENAATAAHVAGLLGQLGAEPPRGLEVPTGADATELKDALSAFSMPGTLVAKFVGIVTGLAGATPWRATVTKVAGDKVTVRLSRNGRTVGSAIINPTRLVPVSLDATATPVDLQRFAAAFILLHLSSAHGGFPGLAGARDWRSLGLHYIATTDLAGLADRSSQQGVLARALDLDPGNRLAQLAFQHALWRQATKPGELDQYRVWLDEFLANHRELPSLVLRAAYTRAVIATNTFHALQIEGRDAREAGVRARNAVAAAAVLVGGTMERAVVPDRRWLEQIAEAITPTQAEPLRDALIGMRQQWGETGLGRPQTPTGAYNMACAYASHSDPLTDDDALQAVRNLVTAAADPENLQWAAQDPQLARLRRCPRYRLNFLSPPRSDFFDLAVLQPYAATLRASDYSWPGALASADATALLTTLPTVSRRRREQIVRLAAAYQALTSVPGLAGYEVEMLDELTGEGYLLRHPVAPSESLAASIYLAIQARCRPLRPADGVPVLSAAVVMGGLTVLAAPPFADA